MSVEPILFGEHLIQYLEKWLPWESSRAVAGLECREGENGDVIMTAHAVESPWGVLYADNRFMYTTPRTRPVLFCG